MGRLFKLIVGWWKRLFESPVIEEPPKQPEVRQRGFNKLGRKLGRRIRRKTVRDLKRIQNHGRGAKK